MGVPSIQSGVSPYFPKEACVARLSLTINGEAHSLELETPHVESLLVALDIPSQKGVAVAVDDRVVPRSQWASTPISNGQHIEIIRATQGG
ncbi:sulfur carrier protein ThiS [Microvenator marinus]|uniref:Sulfur carrier protein ThiS n=1 Tax=Microvenator marinus TaxID=2600177 RepID=A0A5B8XWK4_9DELT|nr:sulfur carrier protein ThiS [Microvenator marinus]